MWEQQFHVSHSNTFDRIEVTGIRIPVTRHKLIKK